MRQYETFRLVNLAGDTGTQVHLIIFGLAVSVAKEENIITVMQQTQLLQSTLFVTGSQS